MAEVCGDESRYTWTYDPLGRQTAMGDATGLTSYTYDQAGRQTQVALPIGRTLSYSYNPLGQRAQLLDQDGGLTVYGYTADGQAQRVLNPFGEVTTWLWDGAGRQVGQVLGNGVAASLSYDAAGQPTARVYRDPSGTPLAMFTATYDPAGNRVQVDELDGSFAYAYDESNQLIDEARTGSHAYHISYTYDPVGNRLAMDQSGAAVQSGFDGLTRYSYNAADELLEVTPHAPDPSDVSLSTMVRAPLSGSAYALTLPLRTSFVYAIDAATLDLVGAVGTWDEANHWQVALTARDNTHIVSTLATATYSSAGQGRVELTPAEPAAVDADATPRLGVSVTKVGSPPPLLSVAGTAYLSGALKPTSYTYDPVGNTLTETGPSGVTTFTWDAENRLVGVETNGDTETYVYDGSTSVPGKVTGLRRSKTAGGSTTQFVWDQQNLLAELDETLANLAQYTDFPGNWGGLSSRRAASASSFYGFDLSANTRALFGVGGAISEATLYSAFGPRLSGASSQPFGFGATGGYFEDAPDRLYIRARELDPRTGRWRRRDPLPARTPLASGYAYCGNAATQRSDPLGLESMALAAGASDADDDSVDSYELASWADVIAGTLATVNETYARQGLSAVQEEMARFRYSIRSASGQFARWTDANRLAWLGWEAERAAAAIEAKAASRIGILAGKGLGVGSILLGLHDLSAGRGERGICLSKPRHCCPKLICKVASHQWCKCVAPTGPRQPLRQAANFSSSKALIAQ